MQHLPKLARILEVVPFRVSLLWRTGEVQTIDFEPLFTLWKNEDDEKMAPLQNWDAFRQVVVSENGTLSWPNIVVSFSYKGKIREEPLELDAQELYRQANRAPHQNPAKAAIV